MITTPYRGGRKQPFGDVEKLRQIYVHPTLARSPACLKGREGIYELLWAYYTNNAFENVSEWFRYIGRNELYPYMRSLFNPVTRIVNFWAENLYRGAWTTNPEQDLLEPGTRLAVPLGQNTPKEIREALAQQWQWSQWALNHSIMITFTALCGNSLTEVQDNSAREVVTYQTYWPSEVKDLLLNESGDVQSYAIEYMSEQPDARFKVGTRQFRYRKEVTKDGTATYKDDKKFDYDGGGAEREHGFGFCPAVWNKHINLGLYPGVSAVGSSIGKIDALNARMTHADDFLHKAIDDIRLLKTTKEVRDAFEGKDEKGEARKVDEHDFAGRYRVIVLQVDDPNAAVESLVGTLDAGGLGVLATETQKELDKDYPETNAWEAVRNLSQVSGIAIDRALGDVNAKKDRFGISYDGTFIKLGQMGMAIGGERVNRGHWRKNTAQQRKFGPFDLRSYERGELDFLIMPRPLVAPTPREIAEDTQARFGAAASAAPFADKEFQLEVAGVSEKKRREVLDRMKTTAADEDNDF